MVDFKKVKSEGWAEQKKSTNLIGGWEESLRKDKKSDNNIPVVKVLLEEHWS